MTRVMSSFMHFSENFSEGYSSYNYSKSNTLNYGRLIHYDNSHSDTLLNSSLVRILHQSKPSIDLDNLLRLLSRSMTVPTNQHETFQRALSSLTCFLRNFPEGHSSHNYFKLSMLNYEFLK
ncbi:hypothetical protein HKD37_14G040860 [Glycine soja]